MGYTSMDGFCDNKHNKKLTIADYIVSTIINSKAYTKYRIITLEILILLFCLVCSFAVFVHYASRCKK